MIIYRLFCRNTGRAYIGKSENNPDLDTLELPSTVQRDIKNFGKHSFTLNRICELNNQAKAEYKINQLRTLEVNPYKDDEPEVMPEIYSKEDSDNTLLELF